MHGWGGNPRVILYGYKGHETEKPKTIAGALNAENEVRIRLFLTTKGSMGTSKNIARDIDVVREEIRWNRAL